MERPVTPPSASIRYPSMRAEVRRAVEALGNPEYQERVWVRRELPQPGYVDDLDVNVHILYDDAVVLPEPGGTVGVVLFADEVEPMRGLGAALDPLIDALGDSPDRVYLDDDRWSAVVAAARTVASVMSENDSRPFRA